ncbi:MAG: hypothetical protein RL172_1349 [Bacteroidota bacterium]|jgi:hypothetical protein
MINRNTILTVGLLLLSVIFFTRCLDKSSKSQGPANSSLTGFAGAEACRSCHQDIYNQHANTMHYKTSALASTATVMADFADSAHNRFYFNNNLYIAAEKRGDSLFQTVYQNQQPKLSRPFNFVTGSGRHGQTFLYWHQNYIFQLPLTYFSATNEWTNSPGYSAGKVQFNRPVTARCLECHSTYFKEETSSNARADQFSKNDLILGIQCEKCHGPAVNHVAYHQQYPADTVPAHIARSTMFNRTQQLDMCRYCHGGRLSKIKPSFSYTAGASLFDYFSKDSANAQTAEPDVHGNQYGLLAASQCFIKSNITCGSCHSPHANQHNNTQWFVAKCNGCHTAPQSTCKLAGKQPAAFLANNCIDCHMPKQASKTILVLQQGASVPLAAFMRTHKIAVYADTAANIILKQTNTPRKIKNSNAR